LDGLFKAFGADLPDNGTVLEARTVIVSLGVGIVVTVLAGLFPALRATRVPPIAAMREGVQMERRHRLIRWRPRVIPALGRAIGSLVAWRGITRHLAREKSVRQPGRTLVTALALTVGLGLVAFISVLAAGTKTTIDNAVNRSFAGNLIVQNSHNEGGIPAAVAPAVRQVHGVGEVTAIAFTKGRGRNASKPGTPVIDEQSAVTAIEPESFRRMYKIEWEHGSDATLATLGQGGTVITKKFASAHHLRVGERLSVATPSSHVVSLTVRGIVKEEVLGLLSNLTISRSLARTAFG